MTSKKPPRSEVNCIFFNKPLFPLDNSWKWILRVVCHCSKHNLDRKERLLYLNRSAENLFNLSLKVTAGKSLGDILTLYPHLQNMVQPLHDALLQNEKVSDYKLNYAREESKLLLAVDCAPVYLFNRLAGAVLLARETTKSKDGNILLETARA